ncbi:phage tail protein [Glaciecola petra]|uniref:Tail fiber protein n=1 Tax=Glaciecola petra TaxID=3075602 RepID=A0ABU2ZU00_9ALTE|nr:tail fiber protein [Aestuariibacter sp. P117]MDT0595736.1 tail fiber protein [Aestuariibacter sp. P117]
MVLSRKLALSVAISTLLITFLFNPTRAIASERYLGEVILVSFNFCPRGTLNADGDLLQISQYQALYALLGTTYGGNGRTTFGLPDLRSRTPIGASNGGTLSPKKHGANSDLSTDSSAKQVGTLAMSYCVVVEGVFPSRQ